MSLLSAYTPQSLWSIFEQLTQIPRPSGHEEAALQFLEKTLDNLGLDHWRDKTGNLMMRKPAHPDCQQAAGVVLQSHIDMVPQKGDGVTHDFTKDPLSLLIEDGWLKAQGTTLGADNGIGVAAIMAVMADKDLRHGPLEALITIDEERGLTGAQGLEAGQLTGSILLNLDSEDEGELFVGCAGGADLEGIFAHKSVTVPKGSLAFKLSVQGLSGGHSGINIHEGRANAIQIVARFLQANMTAMKMGLASLDGGTLPNAIPRSAQAILVLPNRFAEAFQQAFDRFAQDIQEQFSATDPNLTVTCQRLSTAPEKMMTLELAEKLISVLTILPSCATRMEPTAQGVSETSNNLAVVKTQNSEIIVTCMARSLRRPAQDQLVEALSSLFRLAGAEVKKGAQFSGWTPKPDSPLLQEAQAVYQGLFETTAKTNIIHAGLECGLIGQVYPTWDMISFGPTIKGAHSPNERVEIASVEKFWQYLEALLARLGT